MAEGVVDELEAVEVEEQQRTGRPLALAAGERVREPLLQQPPIGKAGQRVGLAEHGRRPRIALGIAAGKAVGEGLVTARALWIASDFRLGREALLARLKPATGQRTEGAGCSPASVFERKPP